jgi:hypothetical protein
MNVCSPDAYLRFVSVRHTWKDVVYAASRSTTLLPGTCHMVILHSRCLIPTGESVQNMADPSWYLTLNVNCLEQDIADSDQTTV